MIYAMSLGLPVISYSTQIGIKDIIDNDLNGYIIKPNAQQEFIDKTLDLISNKKALANLGACARESIRANDINYANNDYLSQVVSNGIGMEKINGLVHDYVTKLGTTNIEQTGIYKNPL